MASTTVDLQALANKTAELLGDAREEFEVSLERVQDVVDNIGWWSVNERTLIDEIGEITFRNYDGAQDLLDNLVFRPLRQQQLVDTGMERHKTHMFISPSLDAAENKIIEILSAAGSGELKNLSGVMLTEAMRSALIQGQSLSDQRDQNDNLALLVRYPTPDDVGNQSWLQAQFERKQIDRQRNIYMTLFALAQENVSWAYKAGIQIEKIHENFTARYNKLYYDITAANIAAYKAEVKANISKFEGDLKAAVAEVEVERLKFTRDSSEFSLKIEQANQRLGEYVREYSGKLSTNLKLLATRIAGGKNVADGYKTIYSAYSSMYSGVSLSNSSEE